MTTDRTALEAARDALPPLPASHYVPDTDPAFTAQQMRDYAAQAVTAALSSPPVLPAEPADPDMPACGDWDCGQTKTCTCRPVGEVVIGAGDTEGWTVIKWAERCPPVGTKLYAAPQEAAPALDDARDADTKRLDWLEQSEARNQWIVAKGADSFTVSPGRRQHATRKTIREAIDAAMQQEPRS